MSIFYLYGEINLEVPLFGEDPQPLEHQGEEEEAGVRAVVPHPHSCWDVSLQSTTRQIQTRRLFFWRLDVLPLSTAVKESTLQAASAILSLCQQ